MNSIVHFLDFYSYLYVKYLAIYSMYKVLTDIGF